jgi:hypothetical protein
LENPGIKGENINMYFRKREVLEWIPLTEGWINFQALENMVMNIPVLQT